MDNPENIEEYLKTEKEELKDYEKTFYNLQLEMQTILKLILKISKDFQFLQI